MYFGLCPAITVPKTSTRCDASNHFLPLLKTSEVVLVIIKKPSLTGIFCLIKTLQAHRFYLLEGMSTGRVAARGPCFKDVFQMIASPPN
ncbi:hypothetical protein QQF64_012487 [Cirrhinus molitorella]|uniref:Uncharacterized protein n=1 Tax=Cirrhinus molitorella TaxID=172907 RepID=A0ABR3LVM1_9TELE